jgi:hypothetical protein
MSVEDLNMAAEKEKTILEVVHRLGKYELVVNFNMELFSFLKEKPNLERHGIKLSITFGFKLHDLKLLYPLVRSI